MQSMAELKVILGIGNPGKQYDGTRHNIGFDVIDALASRYGGQVNNKKWHALYGECFIPGGGKVLMVKPQTYVNESGKSLQAIMTFYKLAPEQCMVVVDDLNLKFGDLRLREQGSAGGHNGLRNIEQRIGKQYPRLRIGIGAPKGNQVNYVLGKFNSDEQADLQKLINKASDACETWLKDTVDAAMRFNGPLNPPPPKSKKPKPKTEANAEEQQADPKDESEPSTGA